MYLCEFNPGVNTCRKCGRVVPPGINPQMYRIRCQTAPPIERVSPEEATGWGTKVASLLSRFGIKKYPGCGCYQREKKLNKFGHKVEAVIRKVTIPLTNLLLGHPKDRRRKQLERLAKNPPVPSQEELERLRAKAERRLALLAEQKQG